MLEKQIKPNSATFTSVLSMCSHLGQVDKGWQVFRMMTRDYGLNPNPEHFGCMVDLFGRSGKLDVARMLIEGMSDPPASVFASLLGSCRHHLNFELGEEMAMKLSDLKPGDPSPLVILSNIYAGAGRWDDVERIREMINARELRKLPGYSSIALT
uniref:Pentatricopeptide repeat-containing protein At2g02750 n=1 Tax=Rhizophora mucronata TaxID=61149 RepID=A0A2P2PQW2_RHIMU